MTTEIKRASELKPTDERKQAIEYCKKWIMHYIEKANAEGRNKTCFTPTGKTINGRYIDCEEELKQIFKDAGYRFAPTGYIGGVWQRTIDIVW